MTRTTCLVAAVATLLACRTSTTSTPAPLHRPLGERSYRFTSSQRSPAGLSRVVVGFTLDTRSDGTEVARLTSYEHAQGDGPLAPGSIDASCAATMGSRPGTIAELPITPPPADLRNLVPPCVPEDLFGAASDILPLLMIQVQPRFRAAELRQAGDRLRFDGYRTGWRQPPALLDAVIVADSGVVSLDSVTSTHRVIGWDTSPMRVTLIRQLGNGQRMRLRGWEWFRAQVTVDQHGTLLRGQTLLDSLSLRVTLPYAESLVPMKGDELTEDNGPVVAVSRRLELVLDPH
ncbi:MAG TPA: hypothetical protein VG817_11760 [Gemmatimonadales bacterium]|nr:hypothetical protein [Gemmatimonadales bacterium]